jgi:hypothetical protein
MMNEASERIRKATESTLELEASVREEMLEEHQEALDEMEEQVREHIIRNNHLEEELHRANSGVEMLAAGQKDEMREELKQAEQRLVELKESLDAHLMDKEADTILDEAVKVVGNHNVKQKIHFVEKLQKDRKELKIANRNLTAEIAKLKIDQARSGFKKFRKTLNVLSGNGVTTEKGVDSPRRKSSSSSPLVDSSRKRMPVSQYLKEKENACANSPRSGGSKHRLTLSSLSSPTPIA